MPEKRPATPKRTEKEASEDDLDVGLRAAFGAAVESAMSDACSPRTGTETRIQLPSRDGRETVVDLPADRSPADRYELREEIGRGGMGVILRGLDTDLGRDVAMKVLSSRHVDNPAMVRRFVEEAQIAGQLQHPGILQVYELGTRDDGRPYFTMRLIKGRTLAEHLASRGSLETDRRRDLVIFERICQTAAYAHARGVIHRDLKPANIMVGNFGEVQIVDWGLAKLIDRDECGGAVDTIIETTRDQDGPGDESLAGSVMGTPAYMPPEQARGEIDVIDERVDVFALGAILCEILTGAPAYGGGNVLDDAKAGNLSATWTRLDACDADEELIDLARRCLAARPSDRPRNGGAVARSIADYLASVEDRIRGSELAAAEARASAAQERRARRLTVALAATIVLVIVGGAVTFMAVQSQRVSRIATNSEHADRELKQLTRLLDEAKQAPIAEKMSWIALRAGGLSMATLRQRAELDAATRGRVDEFLDQFSSVDRDRRLLETIEEVVIVGATHSDADSWLRMESELRGAFSVYGIDLLEMSDEVIVSSVRASEMAVQITDGLWLWFGTLGQLMSLGVGELDDVGSIERQTRRITLLDEADPDAYRVRLRAQANAVEPDLEELLALAEHEAFDAALPRTQSWIAMTFSRTARPEMMDTLYQRALLVHPGDFMLNFDYAVLLAKQERWKEAIGFYRAGLAVRPETGGIWRSLGVAYRELGDNAQALNAFEQSVRYQGDYAHTWVDLGRARNAAGATDTAIEAFRTALELDEFLAEANCFLGLALMDEDRLNDALISLSRGHQLGSKNEQWSHPSREWIDECLRRMDQQDQSNAGNDDSPLKASAKRLIEENRITDEVAGGAAIFPGFDERTRI